jgi:flagellar biosynthesis/type III secretory pathway protein FliH
MTWLLGKPAVRLASEVSNATSPWSLEDLRGGVHDPRRSTPGAGRPAAKTPAQLEAEERERQLVDAYQRGHEDGRTAGEIAEGARLRHAVQAADMALEEMRENEARWAGAVEDNLCALATAIARQIVGRELATDSTVVADLVRRALAEVPLDQPVRIRVHPNDLAVLSSMTNEDGSPVTVTAGREARWLADPRVQPGGCVIEGRDRIIDGRVDTALERVYRRLTYNNA